MRSLRCPDFGGDSCGWSLLISWRQYGRVVLWCQPSSRFNDAKDGRNLATWAARCPSSYSAGAGSRTRCADADRSTMPPTPVWPDAARARVPRSVCALRRHATTTSPIDLRLPDPSPQGLDADPQLLGDTADDALPLALLLDRLEHHPDRPLTQLRWVPALRWVLALCHGLHLLQAMEPPPDPGRIPSCCGSRTCSVTWLGASDLKGRSAWAWSRHGARFVSPQQPQRNSATSRPIPCRRTLSRTELIHHRGPCRTTGWDCRMNESVGPIRHLSVP
jgi:hypothetical protein